MRHYVRAFIIFVTMPLILLAQKAAIPDYPNCRTVYSKHGVTQMACQGSKAVNAIEVAGIGQTGTTHIFIGQTLTDAKKLGKALPKRGHEKCHGDYFLSGSSPNAAALQQPLTNSRSFWKFAKTVARVIK